MSLIDRVRLRRVLDSRGNPTVEADVITESGGFGRAIAPSGASTGEHEAVERPPADAIAAAREHVIPRLERQAFAGDQREVDAAIRAGDGTEDFSEVGVNAAVAISMAAAKAAADLIGIPLYQHLGGAFRGSNFPVPLGNVIGGGAHAVDATDIQEFHAVPVGAPNVADAVFANATVHRTVGQRLTDRGTPANKGDEGAWAPQSITDEEAFEILAEAIDEVEDQVGFEIAMGLDVAAAELFDADDGVYRYSDTERTVDDQIDFIAGLVDDYGLVYIEDPLDENDFDAHARLTERVGGRTLICGDDLYVTNTERIHRGIDVGATNAVLIKPNQIGTLSAAFDAIELAERNGNQPVVSHRSGETEDTTISHLAVAADAPYIKTGAVGGERTAKLNELIRIEQEAL